MFRDFAYLWKHRERPKDLKRLLVVWLKRFVNLIAVFRLLIATVRLRSKGAVVGQLVLLGSSRIEGSCSNLMIGNET